MAGAAGGLAAYLQQLRLSLQPPPAIEPDIGDEKDVPEELKNSAAFRQAPLPFPCS